MIGGTLLGQLFSASGVVDSLGRGRALGILLRMESRRIVQSAYWTKRANSSRGSLLSRLASSGISREEGTSRKATVWLLRGPLYDWRGRPSKEANVQEGRVIVAVSLDGIVNAFNPWGRVRKARNISECFLTWAPPRGHIPIGHVIIGHSTIGHRNIGHYIIGHHMILYYTSLKNLSFDVLIIHI